MCYRFVSARLFFQMPGIKDSVCRQKTEKHSETALLQLEYFIQACLD